MRSRCQGCPGQNVGKGLSSKESESSLDSNTVSIGVNDSDTLSPIQSLLPPAVAVVPKTYRWLHKAISHHTFIGVAQVLGTKHRVITLICKDILYNKPSEILEMIPRQFER